MTAIDLTCERCGVQMNRNKKGPPRRFCSERCRSGILVACRNCGCMFPSSTGRGRACSVECRAQLKIRPCTWCGRRKYKVQHRKETFCSVSCAQKHRFKDANLPRECAACGIEFTPKLGNNAGKCCSRECGWEYQRQNPESKNLPSSPCDKCGSRIKKECICRAPLKLADCPRCGIAFPRRNRKYCSSECRLTAEEEARKAMHRETYQYSSGLKCCQYCGKKRWFAKGYRAGAPHTCPTCERLKQNERRWERLVKNGPIENITLGKLIRRDGDRCSGCGREVNQAACPSTGLDYPTIDHVVPIAKGGTHTWDNVQLMCRMCNSIKSDQLQWGHGHSGQLATV